MEEKLKELKSKVIDKIDNADSINILEDIRVKILGKKGELTLILREMGKLSKEERPVIGKLSNEVRESIEKKLEEKFNHLKDLAIEQKIEKERLDVTANKIILSKGAYNPINKTIDELEDLFRTMGYTVVDGPEIEEFDNNFTYLNFPMDHPSISKSDTFFLDDKHLLRTHTSPVQIRYMKSHKPSIRMVSAGRTFRFDDVDDTHSPMFHQIEGLVVDKGVSLANLLETMNTFVKYLLGENFETRFRPHHFPFTEPSAEVDVTCFNCLGKGCEKCNYTGWSMELLGCGMVHPNVLKNCGIDPEVYTGFAFGMGIDRITMVKYGIDNIRLLYENDKRFLEQF
ncbi:phenylalanine--tRNA ligase subunit alpha [Citroniella saccharovorans]|uniref:Phenylalanine--tRNA ligase alpha subunit n=1 Tax=Citroniella saccharovorans TaxID=2053367 RepID=A0AAW9MQ99_9FIRM|nr:phenylalanine--tRNA ligase subunit alpha [Citroniella saccharovorans]MEB3429728.1 phenylalanine--tRNA ligase subunit alpha [Citroniella saccharovorans]